MSKIKRNNLIGFVCELVLALGALAILITGAVKGRPGLVVFSAITSGILLSLATIFLLAMLGKAQPIVKWYERVILPPLSKFWADFRSKMKTLFTLVKMQLKEKMDMSALRSKKKFFFKLIWLIVEFVLITLIFYFLFYFVQLLGLFSLSRNIPVSVISILFAVMLFFSVITDTVGLMKSLYFSKDNTVLLTFPATPSLIFFSKLVTYYVYELKKTVMFLIPMFIGFGIVKGYGLYYYPWLLLMFILVSTVPVLISALLSIPAMFVYVFLNRVKVLQYILYALAGVGGFLGLWFILGIIPKDINFIETWGDTYWEVQAFLKSYTENFAPIYKFTELIVGKSVGFNNVVFHSETVKSLLIVAAVDIAALVLCFLVSKPLFCRMAATPFEFKKKNSIKEKQNKIASPFRSALRKEWISGLRSNSLLKLVGILVVIMPMAIYLLSSLYASMKLSTFGKQMTVAFTMMIMLLILLMTNIDIASTYSRDGASSYLNKVQPAPYALLLFSKLFFPIVIAFVGTLLTTVIFMGFTHLKPLDAILVGVSVFAVYVFHIFSAAESDIMNPQYKRYATFNDQASNPNESKAALLAVILSIVVAIAALLLSGERGKGVWTKISIVTIALAAFKVITYLAKIKAFYKEKQ